jgi:branched-chain amino acid aminotransferase
MMMPIMNRRSWTAAASSWQLTGRRCISSARLTIERTTQSTLSTCPAKEDLMFGRTISDHMLVLEWTNANQWGDPRIIPYQNLSISPAASCLHYGLQCFEGMKAYKALSDNSLRLFRPELNMKRLASSMDRLHMPGSDFPPSELIQCIQELVRVDQDWIPYGEGYSLYLRPTVIATTKYLGVAAPDSLLLYVITSPVGPYYKSGFKPVRLTADTPFVRAWPGGTGNSKVGGNYAPTMKAQEHATSNGYSQVLWLFGEEDWITEVGAMNVFFYLMNAETQRPELVTPPLDRGDILPGVTRTSILELCQSWGDFDVSERNISMKEIKTAGTEGRLLEAFGAGTAAVVTPIACIRYKGEDVEIPTPSAEQSVTQRIWNEITSIQYGKITDPKGWSVKF